MDIEDLGKHVHYCPFNGTLTWKVSNRGHRKAGDPAGSYNRQGYRRVKIRQKVYLVHRLAWALAYGEWPPGELDHINGIRDDNRICNLRAATRWENCQNITPKGVRFEPSRGKWLARIHRVGKTRNLGRYNSEAEAVAVYQKAARELRGEFYREV